MIRFIYCTKCGTSTRCEGGAVTDHIRIICPICLAKTKTPHADSAQSEMNMLVDWAKALGEDDARMGHPMNFRVTSRPSSKPLTSDQWDFLASTYHEAYKGINRPRIDSK